MHYLAVNKLWPLLRGITSKYNGDFYCLNCLHSFRTEKKFKLHEKVYKNKNFCGITLPTQKHNVLKFNQYMKSDKTPCTIYAILRPWLKKRDNCKKNPEKSSATKIGEHLIWWAFDNVENELSLYRGEDCIVLYCIEFL